MKPLTTMRRAEKGRPPSSPLSPPSSLPFSLRDREFFPSLPPFKSRGDDFHISGFGRCERTGVVVCSFASPHLDSREFFCPGHTRFVDNTMSPRISAISVVLVFFIVTIVNGKQPEVAPLHIPKTSIGEEVSIVCSSIAGKKPFAFFWKKDGSPVEDSKINKITESEGTSFLKIKSVHPSDRGNYSCTARNSFGEDTRAAELSVDGESFSLRSCI